MLESLIIGIVGIVSLSIGWVLVQSFWRKEFADHITDDDVLAGRNSCANCGCTSICEKKSGKVPSNNIH